jgi:pimeloyl-ACP methyl ester carboxylesterase
MRSLLVLLFASILCLNAQTQETFSLKEKPGAYAVGLRTVEQYDRSRDFRPPIDDLGNTTSGETSRPLQTLVWYPAESSTHQHMTVADYLALRSTETNFSKPATSAGLDEWFLEGLPHPSQDITLAIRDAVPMPGRFPVIIYAPSFTSYSWENIDLCEYLASFGYVVIAAPGMGVERDSTHDVAGTDAQAQDISFLVGWSEVLPNTDSTQVGVVGFSWGGLSSVFAAARDNRIKALVDLDGSIRYWPGLVEQAHDVHPDAMTIPLLFFEGRGSLEDQAQLEANFKNAAGPNVLNEWTHGDLLSIEMLGMIHPEFNSVSQRSERYWGLDFPNRAQTDITREDAITGYAWVAKYTREFFDAYLKHDPSAMAFLKQPPEKNGVPKHVLDASFRAAVPLPLGFAQFRKEVAQKGFEHVSDIYASAQLQQSGFSLSPETLTAWAYRLFGEHHSQEAIDVMQLAVHLQPSTRAYGTLGELYARGGQKGAAIENLKKALEIDPGNIIAKEYLDKVQRSPGR